MTKSYVRTATRTTLKVEANLTQILNFKANFHTEFELFFKKKIMLTMVDTLRLSAYTVLFSVSLKCDVISILSGLYFTTKTNAY